MAESRTYRLTSEQAARRAVAALLAAAFDSSVAGGAADAGWQVRVQVEPQTMADAQRLVLEADPDAVDVTEGDDQLQ